MSPFSNTVRFPLVICPFISVLRFMYPIGMFTGAAVIVAVFLGAVWAADNKAIIKNFKKDNPALFVFLVILASYLLMSLFGGVMVFLLGIKLPLICEWDWFMSCDWWFSWLRKTTTLGGVNVHCSKLGCNNMGNDNRTSQCLDFLNIMVSVYI